MSNSHGHTRGGRLTPTYRTWADMLQRCTNPRRKEFHLYGARGIQVCPRWYKFDNFLADMGEAPLGLTIERKHTDGDYEPSNCRWATRAEQSRNKRTTKLTTGCAERIKELRIFGLSMNAIGGWFGVSDSMVDHILAGRMWGTT